MVFIHQRPDWPKLRWDNAKLLPLVADVRHRQGRLLGRMEGLGFRLRAEASLTTLTSDVIKPSAIVGAEAGLPGVLRKAKVWEQINSQSPVNERQRKVINRPLDGFEGKLSTSIYAKLAKCSADTALRDIKILLDRGILIQEEGGGRNTSYRLVEPKEQS